MPKTVSSSELLEFIKAATVTEVKLDSDGQPLYMQPAPLSGDALAAAIGSLMQVIGIEHNRELGTAQLEAHMRVSHGGGHAVPWPSGQSGGGIAN